MDTAEIEVFLMLAEELHFGRTAERLRLPQPRVSRLVAALERRAGGALFERTSRRVRLTPLGQQLASQLRPAYAQLTAALDDARADRRHLPAAGPLRTGDPPRPGGAQHPRAGVAGGPRPDRAPDGERDPDVHSRRHRAGPDHRPAAAAARADLGHRARERQDPGSGRGRPIDSLTARIDAHFAVDPPGRAGRGWLP